ncbi:HU family DNA-binding protein [Polymorphobacter sp.]|uniref:HU family DNA-binding protein n=1 Tax=Polymorphobacter sp. TaxID=1909290 RepID=UPI003F724106
MNKQDLAGHLSARTGLTRDAVAGVIDAMLDEITKALSRGEEVRLVGFGNFVVAERKATTGRNPRTGEPMDLDPCLMPKFRVGRNLKDACNRALPV